MYRMIRWSYEVTLGNVLVILTVASVGIGIAVILVRFFYRLFEIMSWLLEMYFHYCQQTGQRIPDWLYQRYRTINGNTDKTPPQHPPVGTAKSASIGEFK